MSMFAHPSRFASPVPGLAFADLGQYFVATTVPGTPLATIAAQASLADTAPFVSIITGGKTLVLDYLRLTVTAVGSGAAGVRFATKFDALKTQATGGSALTPANTNNGSGLAAVANVRAGALVAGAAISATLIGAQQIRSVAPVAGDVYLVKYGGVDSGIASLLTTGVAQTAFYLGAPPVVVQPSQTLQLHVWMPSQSAASSFDLELGFWEF